MKVLKMATQKIKGVIYLELKVGDRVKVKSEFDFYEEYRGKQFVIEECDSSDDTYLCRPTTGGYRIWFSEEKLKPVVSTLADIKEKKLTCVIHTKTKREADMLFKAVDSYDHNGKTWASWWDVYKEKTCYRTNLGEVVAYGCMDNYSEDGEKVIEFSDLVATDGTISIHNLQTDALSAWATNVQLDKETVFNGLSQVLKRATEVYSSTKEEKNLKFTFYFNVNEGTRVDKSCNGTIPTITTSVVLDKFGDPDKRKCYSLEGEATCDKADYDMRQGVLEALANAVFDGNFEKAYDKAVKTNAFCERQDRTCHYCGKVLDTIEEKQAHEAWHVERKKARRERYLLRKRAKEIAFKEAAQKMAKEMIKEDK